MRRFRIPKYALVIVLFCFGKTEGQSLLSHTSWMATGLFGQEGKEAYSIFPADKNNLYGNYLRFADSVHFVSGNSGPCGNECRIIVYGRYFLTGNEIKIYTDSTVYWKQCADTPTERRTRFEGTFLMRNTGDSIVLQRRKPEE